MLATQKTSDLPFVIQRYRDAESWLAGRSETVGASEVAAALGLSPWESAYSLWSKKVGLSPPSVETRPMRRGAHMESFVASEYALETKRQLVDHGRYAVHRSTLFPFLSFTPDRIIVGEPRGPAPLEIKSVTNRSDWADGEVPEHYRIQVVASLAVSGYRWGVLCGYIAGTDELIHVEIERNEEHIEALVDTVHDFWRLVEDGRAVLTRGEEPKRHPDIDASEATMMALRARYRTETSQEEIPVLSEPDLEQEWAAAAADEKNAKARVQAAKNRMMALMGNRPEVYLPGGTRVSWKTCVKAAYTVEAQSTRVLNRYAPKEKR